jgi:hypothetical protein
VNPADSATIHGEVRQFVPTHRGYGDRDLVGLRLEEGCRVGGLVWVKGGSLLLNSVGPYWKVPSHLERLWYILHLLLETWKRGPSRDGFSPLNRRLLDEQIGQDFVSGALEELRRIGFIERDDDFVPGSKSYGYRFTKEIEGLEAEPRRLSPNFTAKLRRWHRKRIAECLAASPPRKILWKNLHHLSLHPSCDSQLPPNLGEENQIQRDYWRMAIDSVNRARWRISRDKRTGRVFNNFTSLPKAIRHRALLAGQPCTEIDIRNSQPFFLAGLYPDECEEKQRFVEFACSGCFYERVNEASGTPLDASNRDALKPESYQFLFGKAYTFKRSLLWPGMEKLFPEMAEIITRLKWPNHNRLAIELQRREAEVMIGKVVPRFAAAFPGVPFLTVHDSIAIPHQYADAAKALLADAINEATGYLPQFKVTPPPEELLTGDRLQAAS